MNNSRIVNNFLEMIKIHSPSKNEKEFSNYLINIFKNLGGEIYLDNNFSKYGGNTPVIFIKFKGVLPGDGITLAAHMDVVEPCLNVETVIDNNIIRTKKVTTLGGDDKAGIASIIEVIRTLKEKQLEHIDIYILLTPCEEIGMLGAKNIDWSSIPKNIYPASNILVIDNAGKSGIIAHSAPSKYELTFKFIGKKAHAGIEPEKGVNAICIAANSISKMKIGRIDEFTTSNISYIQSNYPTNVVPDTCTVIAEIRGHSEDKIKEIISSYKKACEETVTLFNGSHEIDIINSYPALKSKDNLFFAKSFAKIYENMGIKTELKIIGGGSDSNILAKEGFNSIIIGAGMYNVHTYDEYLDIDDLVITTKAILNYVTTK